MRERPSSSRVLEIEIDSTLRWGGCGLYNICGCCAVHHERRKDKKGTGHNNKNAQRGLKWTGLGELWLCSRRTNLFDPFLP